MRYIYLSILLSSCLACATQMPNSKQRNLDAVAIMAVMHMQERAWSDGNVEQFMTGYWKSDSLSFIGRSGPQFGWQTTLDNYKKGYPTTEKMGTLTFDILDLKPLAKDVYYMIGKYTLVRTEDIPTGYFSLVWKKIDGNWVILSDHTSG